MQIPYLNSNFIGTNHSRAYDQIGTFSSVNNLRCHVLPLANYRTNGTIHIVNVRLLSRDKLRSREYKKSPELTQGPLGHYNNFPLQASTTKDDFTITTYKDKYDLLDSKSGLSW